MPTENKTDGPGYAVGNKRPPRQHQFKPGRSGNASGRPKGSLGFKAKLKRELQKIVTVQRNGRPTKMPKEDVIILRMVEDSMRGDFKASALVERLTEENDALAQTLSKSEDFTMPDKAALKRIAARLGRIASEDS